MRDFNKEIADAKNRVEVLEKEMKVYIDEIQCITLKQLNQLPIDKFLDAIEKSISYRVAMISTPCPCSPNEQEICDLWKVFKK